MRSFSSAVPQPLHQVLPSNLGELIRKAREARGPVWTQAFLAARVGVTREAIARLENRRPHGRTAPRPRLMEALARELGAAVPDFDVDAPDPARPDRGFRANAARRAAGLTLAKAARAAGVSAASLSLFERGVASPLAIVGRRCDDDGRGVESNAYARELGFLDAEHMSEYLDADDPLPWLVRIAEAHGRKLPPLATLPAKRQPPPVEVLSSLEADLMACL